MCPVCWILVIAVVFLVIHANRELTEENIQLGIKYPISYFKYLNGIFYPQSGFVELFSDSALSDS